MENGNVPINRISVFFTNKTILITGGTGFLGKVLIEKLLRSCPNLEKIYVIARPKKGVNPEERFQKIFSEPLFGVVKQQRELEIFSKVHTINGDISAPDLGLSPEDRQKIISEVEIIYHSAATVKLEEAIKFTVFLNVRGTKLLLELAKECRNLLVFTHISTTFCQEKQKVLREKFCPSPVNAHELISVCQRSDEDFLKKGEKLVRVTSLTNYTFSKAVAESLIEENLDALPVIVQRPSLVISSWQEPFPGWTDNLNNVSGIITSEGTGVLRAAFMKNPDAHFINCCPVDVVVKDLIVNTYYYHIYKNQRVFNIVAPKEMYRDMSMKQVTKLVESIYRNEVPFSKVLWYPSLTLTSSRLRYIFVYIFRQLVLAVVYDVFRLIRREKPFLVKSQKIIHSHSKLMENVNSSAWDFEDGRKNIQKILNSTEFEVFGTNFDQFDLHEYFVNYVLGLRRYIFKDTDDSIPADLRRIKLLWYLDIILKSSVFLGILLYVKSKL